MNTKRLKSDPLVQVVSTAPGSAVTVQLAVSIFDGELVIVGELFPAVDLPQCEDDDVFLTFHINHPGVTVGLARVVDETGGVAVRGGVHYVEVVDAEHVAADPL